jgi:hypothetical protein
MSHPGIQDPKNNKKNSGKKNTPLQEGSGLPLGMNGWRHNTALYGHVNQKGALLLTFLEGYYVRSGPAIF